MVVEKKEFDAKKSLADMSEKALTGKGFVIFVGVLTDKKDKDGNRTLDFNYTRHHYGLEDLPKAIVAFKEHCRKDAVSMMDRAPCA